MMAMEASPSQSRKLARSIPVWAWALPESPRSAAEGPAALGAVWAWLREGAAMRRRTEADPSRPAWEAPSAADPVIQIPQPELGALLRRRAWADRLVREWR